MKTVERDLRRLMSAAAEVEGVESERAAAYLARPKASKSLWLTLDVKLHAATDRLRLVRQKIQDHSRLYR